MPDQDDVTEPLASDGAKDVGDVQRKIDVGVKEVCPLAEAGERRRERGVSARPQPVSETLPAPAAVPGAVDEKKGLWG